MTKPSAEHVYARRLFEKQIDCLISDDRDAQMELYTEDLRYEFPFAADRPRLIEGRENFRKVMAPLWEDARKKGARVTSCRSEFHATDEPGLFVAVFTLDGRVGEKGFSLPFVQLLRVRSGRIAGVREFFSSHARGEL